MTTDGGSEDEGCVDDGRFRTKFNEEDFDSDYIGRGRREMRRKFGRRRGRGRRGRGRRGRRRRRRRTILHHPLTLLSQDTNNTHQKPIHQRLLLPPGHSAVPKGDSAIE
jgi:hypothetical protein